MKVVARVVLVLLVMTLPAIFGGTALADHNTCNHDIHNPHFSDGARGVVVKADYWCSGHVDSISFLLYLFWCDQTDPTGYSRELVKMICLRVGTNEDTIVTPAPSPPAGHVVRTSPPDGSPAHGQDGWYIGFSYAQSKDRHDGVIRLNDMGWKRNAAYVDTPGSFGKARF